MHAVVVAVSVAEDAPDPSTHLRETVVPMISQLPGFVGGYWVRLLGNDQGRAVIVFDSEDAARSASEKLQPAPGVTLNSVDIGEVVANA